MTRRYGVTKVLRQSLLATLLLPGLALAEPVLDLQWSALRPHLCPGCNRQQGVGG